MAKKASKRKTPAEFLKHLQELTDDTESVSVAIMDHVRHKKNDGSTKEYSGVGAVLNLCDGGTRVISIEDAERLINDGVLQRMKIKIRLVPHGQELN